MSGRAAEDKPVFAPDETMLLTSPRLSEYPFLKHGSTIRNFNPPESPRTNDLQRLQQHIGLPSLPIFVAQQTHTNSVGVVDVQKLGELREDGRFVFKETDAIVCALPNVSIAIFTADCTPLFLLDPERRIMGLVHAGWRGTLGLIAKNAVEEMAALGSSPADLIAWIGPSIGGCCYEVSTEMIEQFRAEFGTVSATGESFFAGRLLDLAAVNTHQLVKAGIKPANIENSGICTLCCKDRFYSYRGDGKGAGRIISIMTMLDRPLAIES